MPLLAAVSDIHGNAVAFEAVLEDIRAARPDVVAVCGDLAFDGPEPDRVVDIVRDLETQGTLVMQGHADILVADFDYRAALPRMWRRGRSLRAVAEWTHEALGAERVSWLRDLPYERRLWIDDFLVLFCHGAPGSPMHELDMKQAEAGDLETDARLICCGHTHVPAVADTGGVTIVNAGSAGYPLDGDPRASWALVDVGARKSRAVIRRVPYDVEEVTRALAARGLPGDAARAKIIRTAKSSR